MCSPARRNRKQSPCSQSSGVKRWRAGPMSALDTAAPGDRVDLGRGEGMALY